jgi:hypothetical protein
MDLEQARARRHARDRRLELERPEERHAPAEAGETERAFDRRDERQRGEEATAGGEELPAGPAPHAHAVRLAAAGRRAGTPRAQERAAPPVSRSGSTTVVRPSPASTRCVARPRRAAAVAAVAVLAGLVPAARAQPYVPLPELAAPYLGAGEPGLYPGGANEPAGDHLAAGLARAALVAPRAADGTLDPGGLVGLVLLGMSNTHQEGARVEREADRRGEHAGRVVIVGVAQGGADAFAMDEPTDSFWTLFDQRLAAAGVDPDQVQVAWLKSSLAGEATSGEFPERMDAFRAALRGVVGALGARCPNLELVFLSSRIWTAALARQTFAYEGGFAVKGLIQDQLDDVGGLAGGAWLGWGPYLWADGATPRADGFLWLPSDLEADGVHPAPAAEWKVADLLGAHFREHPLAADWYLPPDDTSLLALDAAADAVVDPAQPDLPDGNGTRLAFDLGRRIYLRFDLAGLAAPVVHAKLSLLVDESHAVGPADLHLVADGSWSEAALTWNSAPPLAVPEIATVPSLSRGGAWSAAVTAAVEAARLAGDPAVGFALVPAGGGAAAAAFLAREAGEPPRLVLTLAAPPAEVALFADGFESGDAWFWQWARAALGPPLSLRAADHEAQLASRPGFDR